MVMKKSKSALIERTSHQSAAEFFSEHQQIAGFDNPGKSLFTTIRELVENSLDAAESIHAYPAVSVKITEYTEDDHNKRHGINIGKVSSKQNVADDNGDKSELDALEDDAAPSKGKGSLGRSSSTSSVTARDTMYYDIQCRDNGCGIVGEEIGELLGRVLSGSKHGIRQTRGKFGLGAKMALIWSKKSSGLPITIRSAHCTDPMGEADFVETVVLDMDIQRNLPKILSRNRTRAADEIDSWRRGLEMDITIGGSWAACRSRVLQYFQQLAVITPYAQLTLEFESLKDSKKNFQAEFVRRSDQMPPISLSVLPHAKSLNNITMSHLLRDYSVSNSGATLEKFLTSAVAGVLPRTATTIADSLGLRASSPGKVNSSQVAALCQVLRDDPSIRPPSAQCLSPAGEYNLRLGVLKELQPRLVATYTDKPGVHEGHSFLVEAAVSLGGSSVREGINIFRFANRIPLLFETGADVVTQVATRRIKWSSYLIDPKKDSIGVYVSIVSTRIPFKGTSKEYIGDDVLEIQYSVRRALMGCCQQMRVHLAENQARRDVHERRKALLRYIPDISSALVTVVQKINDKTHSTSKAYDKWEAIFTALEPVDDDKKEMAKNKRKPVGDSPGRAGPSKRLKIFSTSRIVDKLTETAHKVSNSTGIDEKGGGETAAAADKKGSASSRAGEVYLVATTPRDCSQREDISLSRGRWVQLSGMKTGKVFVPRS